MTPNKTYLEAAVEITNQIEQEPGSRRLFRRAALFALLDIAYTLRDIRSELRARPIG